MAMWWRLALIGTIAAASMALAPFERFGEAPIDPLLLRILSVIQPTILVLLCTALGLWAAPRVGFDAPTVRAWAERRPIWPALFPQIVPAVVGGTAIAAFLVVFWIIVRRQDFAAPILSFELPLMTKILYGGIVEELLLRWGIMSLFVWIAWRLRGSGHPVSGSAVWSGLVAASLLFAAGHLPVLYFLLPEPPPWFVALVLAANLVPGIVFGWLYWRRGLEAAMIAHALAHLLSTTALQAFAR